MQFNHHLGYGNFWFEAIRSSTVRYKVAIDAFQMLKETLWI